MMIYNDLSLQPMPDIRICMMFELLLVNPLLLCESLLTLLENDAEIAEGKAKIYLFTLTTTLVFSTELLFVATHFELNILMK